ncbi:MAG: ABC transporter substrate-binding protein [Candidatus Paceibacterota bacterium]|jgi:branched-chain amino acid transport system substrate-binding protein
MQNFTKWIVIIIVIILIIAGGWYYGKGEDGIADGSIKVGIVVPLTGKNAEWGQRVQKGVDIALEQVGDKNVQVIYEDFGDSLERAASAANKLITVDKVQVLFCQPSDACGAIAPIAQSNKVVILGFTNTPGFTKTGKYVFNMRGDAFDVGKMLGQFAVTKYKKAVIFYLNNPTQKGSHEGFAGAFRSGGGQVVLIDSHLDKDMDFRTVLARAKAEQPDILVFMSRVQNEVAMIKQARELGLNQPIIAGLGIDTKGFLDGSGTLAEDVIYPASTLVKNVEKPILKEALIKYREKYNETMPVWTAESYDAILLLNDAANKRLTDNDQIRDYLITPKNFPGLASNNNFNSDRLIIKSYSLFTVKNGQFVPLEQ